MKIEKFSKKQLSILNWWVPASKFCDYNAIICDGAVRAGKTMVMSLSFIFWSFASYNHQTFAVCGRSVKSVNRNLIVPLTETLAGLGFKTRYIAGENLLCVSFGRQENRYYLFGGNNSASASIIQGITLAGVLFDEAALMPRDFVEQALARCSIKGAKFWFNCNPGHPSHWFYQEWILKKDSKLAYYLHFKMTDNPSLDKDVLARYKSIYSGVFYQRFVEGIWTAAYGAVYPMFCEKHIVNKLPSDLTGFIVSCDYGTTNPTTFGLWGYSVSQNKWIRMREYYHCSKATGVVKTDSQYHGDLISFLGEISPECIIVDPSAASFIQCLRANSNHKVMPAINEVNIGIQNVSNMLLEDSIGFHESCGESIKEFQLYCWDLNAKTDKPVKKNDHCMDDIRYFASWLNNNLTKNFDFYAIAKER